MAFEAKAAKYTIAYTPTDVASIRAALRAYGELIATGKGFEHDFCLVAFAPDVDVISLDFFQSQATIAQFLEQNRCINKEDDAAEPGNLINETLTETLFFACALRYPELKDDVKQACEDIVSFARETNDSAEMWLTYEDPFGLTPLLLTATLYPEYGYLLAGYLVPYWDDEYMPEPLSLLEQWRASLGITADTLKAFCYCDNSNARAAMLGYDVECEEVKPLAAAERPFDLISFFRESDSNYQLFKDLLVERFQQQAFLQYSSNIQTDNPLKDMLINMMLLHYPYNAWLDDFDPDLYLTQQFIDSSAEAALFELTAYVEQQLGRGLLDAPQREMRSGKTATDSRTMVDNSANITLGESYHHEWLRTLTRELEGFGLYGDNVDHECLSCFYKLIANNRDKALALLPKKLLNIEYAEAPDDKLIVASLVLAALILQREPHDNALAKAAAIYLDAYAVEQLLKDLWQSTDLPQQYLVDRLPPNSSMPLSPSCQQEIAAKLPAKSALCHYIETGRYAIDDEVLSQKASDDVALNAMRSHLRYESDEISAQQPQICWLGYDSVRENTQKLLYVAHIAAQYPQLGCAAALGRVLKLAFELAPVRVGLLLSKVYQEDEYLTDDHERMQQMLDLFMQQGLSEAGCWAFIMEQYARYEDVDEEPRYVQLLTDWVTRNHPAPKNTFLSTQKVKKRKTLEAATQLLPRSLQLTLLNDAAELFPESDFCSDYDQILLDTVSRALQREGAVLDVPVYFKNRLINQQLYCEYIANNEWQQHPARIEQILQHTPVAKPDNLSSAAAYYQQAIDSKRHQYIILQQQDEKLVPMFGTALLWAIQQGVMERSTDQASINFIIIDRHCPQAYYEEMLRLASEADFVDYVRQQVLDFISGAETSDQVQHLLRNAINQQGFLESRSYHDVELSDVLLSTSPTLQHNTLRLLGMVSHQCLQLDLELDETEYFELLMRIDVDKQAILKMLLVNNNMAAVAQLAQRVDIRALVLQQKIADQIAILTVLAQQPSYGAFIRGLEQSESLKLRQHVQALITQHGLKPYPESAFHIVDFGVYDMAGNTDPESGSTRKTAREPQCIVATTEITPLLGMFFGFRFTATDPANAPRVLVHNVHVVHPIFDANSQTVKMHTSTWQQNGYSNANIFLGWHFETADELIAGQYHFSAVSTEGKLLAEKTFTVL